MSNIDELRALLDERGVAHRDFKNATTWIGAHSETVIAYIVKSGELLVKHVLTPEQAIAVTLGSAREAELRDALNEVADKWAKAQVEAEDLARENMLLKAKLEAATSGSDGRYDAGFSNGIKATLHQIDGLIYDATTVDELKTWVECEWEAVGR